MFFDVKIFFRNFKNFLKQKYFFCVYVLFFRRKDIFLNFNNIFLIQIFFLKFFHYENNFQKFIDVKIFFEFFLIQIFFISIFSMQKYFLKIFRISQNKKILFSGFFDVNINSTTFTKFSKNPEKDYSMNFFNPENPEKFF